MAGQARRLFRYPPQEVIWITSSAGYVNFEFLKITTPTIFHQRFEPGTFGSESQCSSTELSWDLYVKGGDNVFNAKGRTNEIAQSWCLADLLDIQLPTTGTSHQASYRPYANTCNIPATTHTWVLFTDPSLVNTLLYCRPILANGLLWPGDQHRVSEGGLYSLRLFSIGNLLKM